MSFAGKGVIITGGAKGIGAACAWEFLSKGANVLLADINMDAANETAFQMAVQYTDRKIRTFKLDVRKQSECFAMADYAVQELGQVNIAVNSAGIISPCPSLDVTQDDWMNLISINLSGVFYCCQAAGRIMKDAGGVIINLSSIASKAAWPGRVSYAAAKTGITGITESLAVEWASLGIRVNAVAPSWVNTDLVKIGVEKGVVAIEKLNRAIPLGRIAEVDDISKVISFLASEDAKFITGQIIYVDGGYLVGAPAASIR
jgi:NAD(P)-dependent dehydrogenase (short-subunit alcohol dehydrogenase family)